MNTHTQPWRSWCSAAALLLVAVALPAQSPPGSRPLYGMDMREVSIPLPDGIHLAADLYVPAGAPAGTKFPVLLEYLPYRKTESRGRNWPLYSYFVARGYIVARVDIRGTGKAAACWCRTSTRTSSTTTARW
jgi:predicted acyl esterase